MPAKWECHKSSKKKQVFALRETLEKAVLTDDLGGGARFGQRRSSLHIRKNTCGQVQKKYIYEVVKMIDKEVGREKKQLVVKHVKEHVT